MMSFAYGLGVAVTVFCHAAGSLPDGLHIDHKFGAYANHFSYQPTTRRDEQDAVQPRVSRKPGAHPYDDHDGPEDDENEVQKGFAEGKGMNKENEIGGFMQTYIDNPAWYAFLRSLRVSLENMTKAKRAAVVHAMLCRLDWHATNRKDGYMLGHMRGRTAEILAVLVAFKDETEYDPAEPVPGEVEGMWNEATHFVEMHPGSARARGMRAPSSCSRIGRYPRNS